MANNRPLPPAKQQGMALLVVLLILSVMVIIASNMSGRLQLELRRTSHLTSGKQAGWYALSAEALVSKVLAEDFKKEPKIVHLGQNWARKDAIFPVEDGQLTGELSDEQACFNLNSLSVAKKEGNDGEDLNLQPYPVQVFRELLKQLNVDEYEAAQITDAIRDWTDKDTVLVSSLGAEDAYYEGLKPPYLTANQWMLSKDELRAVRGVSAPIYQRLSAYVCALPNDKLKVNINTLSSEHSILLSALYLGKLSIDEANRALLERPKNGWQEAKLLTDQLSVALDSIKGLKESLVVKSDYFMAQIVAQVGDRRAWLSSHFQRSQENKLVLLRRQQGSVE